MRVVPKTRSELRTQRGTTLTPLFGKHWSHPAVEQALLKWSRIFFLTYYLIVIALHFYDGDWLYWTMIYGMAWVLTLLSFHENDWHKHLYYIYGGGCFFYSGLLATRLLIDLPIIVPAQYYEVASLLVNVVWFYTLGLSTEDRSS